jgi:hypothetical protein
LVEWWLVGETEVLGENLPSAALSTTNPTCFPDANPGRRGGKTVTNRLSYGTAYNESLRSSSKETVTVQTYPVSWRHIFRGKPSLNKYIFYMWVDTIITWLCSWERKDDKYMMNWMLLWPNRVCSPRLSEGTEENRNKPHTRSAISRLRFDQSTSRI